MHNMLTTLSLIAMIGAAVLSFMNKDNLANAQEDQVAKQKTLKAAETDLADSKATLENLQNNIAATTKEGDDFAKEAAANLTQIDAKDAELEEVESELDAAKDERDSQKEKLAEVGDLEAAVKRLEEVQTENATLSTRLGSLTSESNSLAGASENLQSQIDGISQQIKDAENGKVPDNFAASIAQVYPQWGFVVLAAGNEQRAAEGATLAVLRGGVEVAQLKITDLLQNRAVADVLPGTLSDGVTLEPGDRVFPAAQ